jgi:hypothetical protein
MSWLAATIERLATTEEWSYHESGPAATEPTALAALALLAHGQDAKAERAANWLARVQNADGSIGVTSTEATPCWPTSLAVSAWQAMDDARASTRYRGCFDRAVAWLLAARGHTSERSPLIGHDTTLVGWPWVLGTHSWLEPTALGVLALKASGHREHPRTKTAVKLLVDRLLASGGCNYGNTIVMGQALLPHIQPTGLVLLALAGEAVNDPRIERSLVYLEKALRWTTAVTSLAIGIVALTAHGRRPADADALLDAAMHGYAPLGRRAVTDAWAAIAALPGERIPFTSQR